MVQADIGVPELYALGIGIITEDQWVLSVMGNGILLRGAGFAPARGIGVQVGKTIETNHYDDVVPLPNYIVLEPTYLYWTPKSEGDGIAVSIYAGYANFERIGFNTHLYLGFSVNTALGYHPLYVPSLKIGMNYNFPSQE